MKSRILSYTEQLAKAMGIPRTNIISLKIQVDSLPGYELPDLMSLVAFVNAVDTTTVESDSPAEKYLKAYNELMSCIRENKHIKLTNRDTSDSVGIEDGFSVYLYFGISVDIDGKEFVPYMFELVLSAHILPDRAIPRALHHRDKARKFTEIKTGVEIKGDDVIAIHYVVDGTEVESVDVAIELAKNKIDSAVKLVISNSPDIKKMLLMRS